MQLELILLIFLSMCKQLYTYLLTCLLTNLLTYLPMVANPETVKGEAESEASVHVFCVMLILELNDRHDKKNVTTQAD